jgi:hypothetical protein
VMMRPLWHLPNKDVLVSLIKKSRFTDVTATEFDARFPFLARPIDMNLNNIAQLLVSVSSSEVVGIGYVEYRPEKRILSLHNLLVAARPEEGAEQQQHHRQATLETTLTGLARLECRLVVELPRATLLVAATWPRQQMKVLGVELRVCASAEIDRLSKHGVHMHFRGTDLWTSAHDLLEPLPSGSPEASDLATSIPERRTGSKRPVAFDGRSDSAAPRKEQKQVSGGASAEKKTTSRFAGVEQVPPLHIYCGWYDRVIGLPELCHGAGRAKQVSGLPWLQSAPHRLLFRGGGGDSVRQARTIESHEWPHERPAARRGGCWSHCSPVKTLSTTTASVGEGAVEGNSARRLER